MSLKAPKTTKASGMKWQAPASPFQALSDSSVDVAWLSEKTGNTISVLSECQAPTDRSLETLQSESLSLLSKLEKIEEQSLDFNGRRALRTKARGEVDGIPVMISVVTLKKNGCNYSLSFTGVSRNHGQETEVFERFLQSFEAP